MTRRLAGTALLVLLDACGGSDSQPPGAFAGTFRLTGIQCNGGSGPPTQTARIAAPYSSTWVSSDGYALSSTFSDGTCTIAFPFTVSYQSSSTETVRGSGASVTCAPSAGACASLSALFGGAACDMVSNEPASTWSFTSIPTVAGGTVTLTATGGPAGYTSSCSDEGLTGPLTYTLTKQ